MPKVRGKRLELPDELPATPEQFHGPGNLVHAGGAERCSKFLQLPLKATFASTPLGPYSTKRLLHGTGSHDRRQRALCHQAPPQHAGIAAAHRASSSAMFRS
jgi:hypothetical protein